MERAVFDRMAELDDKHWWFVARRRILSSLIKRRIPLAGNFRILEIGCGFGHNFEMLGNFGHVDGLEIDDAARALASKRLGRAVGKLDAISYFNTLLFPLAAAGRLTGKLLGKKESDNNLPPGPVNGVLGRVFGLERHLVGRIPLAAGASLVAIES